MNLSKYNGNEVANLALAQGGSDFFSGGSSTVVAGESTGHGFCDERVVFHTTKEICNLETGGYVHTNAPVATHPNTNHWISSFSSWISVVILDAGTNDLVLTPIDGDVVTLTQLEQADLLGVNIPGPWKSIRQISGGKLLAHRG